MKPLHAAVQSPRPIINSPSKNTSNHRKRIKHSSTAAEKYCYRNLKKHTAEMELIDRGLSFIDHTNRCDSKPFSILDAPCGVGRATIHLARKGFSATGIDLGEGAIKIAREQVTLSTMGINIDRGDLLNTPYLNDQFDAILCFRFFHHLPTPKHRQQIIAELCRVSQKYVLISYLSPWSPTSIKRQVKDYLTGKSSYQHRTSLRELQSYFATQNYELVKDVAQTPFIHSLHLAIFRLREA